MRLTCRILTHVFMILIAQTMSLQRYCSHNVTCHIKSVFTEICSISFLHIKLSEYYTVLTKVHRALTPYLGGFITAVHVRFAKGSL